MQINIYSFVKSIAFEQEIQEYTKRVNYKINIIKLKPSNSTDGDICKKQEAEIFLTKHKASNKLILLDEKGKLYNSTDFAKWLDKEICAGGETDFLIGGAFGLAASLKERANLIISLSSLTFPHKFVPLLLAEQIYRGISIINNHPYHKV
ncbi:MAG: 23S rRNA (pseudouridine(1915)-N(3))-methyltransferase RlmH [Rickettsiales bacterium]|jgi:23S rRNA (pseudouridine1915-N3)-methyltransferase|nr:23S rRNA (pseudouridine(1915)-N(3))-methyltransferase RlmH [Rickettsiales bacterium]